MYVGSYKYRYMYRYMYMYMYIRVCIGMCMVHAYVVVLAIMYPKKRIRVAHQQSLRHTSSIVGARS